MYNEGTIHWSCGKEVLNLDWKKNFVWTFLFSVSFKKFPKQISFRVLSIVGSFTKVAMMDLFPLILFIIDVWWVPKYASSIYSLCFHNNPSTILAQCSISMPPENLCFSDVFRAYRKLNIRLNCVNGINSLFKAREKLFWNNWKTHGKTPATEACFDK